MKRLVVLIILCCITTCLYSQVPTLIYATKQTRNTTIRNLPPKINAYLSLEFVGIDVQEIAKHDQFVIEYSGKQVTIKKDRLKIRGENDFYFSGSSEQNERLSLSVMENDLQGVIEDGVKTYTIETINKDSYVIVEYDPAQMEEAHVEIQEQVYEEEEERNLVENDTDEEISTFLVEGENDCKIKVLVLYTPQAAAMTSNIINTVKTAIEYTNSSFVNSSIYQELELVYVGQTNYTETGYNNDLNRFVSETDGYMDEVHTLRNKYSADICVLLFYESGSICGIAEGISVNSDRAFCIVNVNNGCATSYYSFGHEIGHLMGCRHNIETDPTNSPYAHGHGYISPDKTWRTIMSYNKCNNCPRIRYWSNPDVKYNGSPMGTASTHNNARVWNERASTVMNFRQPKDVVAIDQTDMPNTQRAYVVSKQHVTLDNITINNKNVVKVKAGISVILEDGFEIKNGADFSVEVGSVQDCE